MVPRTRSSPAHAPDPPLPRLTFRTRPIQHACAARDKKGATRPAAVLTCPARAACLRRDRGVPFLCTTTARQSRVRAAARRERCTIASDTRLARPAASCKQPSLSLWSLGCANRPAEPLDVTTRPAGHVGSRRRAATGGVGGASNVHAAHQCGSVCQLDPEEQRSGAVRLGGGLPRRAPSIWWLERLGRPLLRCCGPLGAVEDARRARSFTRAAAAGGGERRRTCESL